MTLIERARLGGIAHERGVRARSHLVAATYVFVGNV